jgi:hypothetical protein
LHCSHFRSGSLSFLHSPEYIMFCVDFLHTGRIRDYLHARFFSEFFETSKYRFQKKSKTRLQGARELKRRTHVRIVY